MDLPSSPIQLNESFSHKLFLRRQDTPSTMCGEQDEFHGNEASVDSLTKLRLVRESTKRVSRGLSLTDFNNCIRQPFRFPNTPRQPITSTPVCIICRGHLQPGQLCREIKGCGHCFHALCAETHFQSHSRCPVCRFKCKTRKEKTAGSMTSSQQRPFWTPDYDSELLVLSDRLDRERRQKVFLLKGKRDNVPQSYIFLRSTLPTVLEESQEALQSDDGTLLFLCRHVYRERESRKLMDIGLWTQDMKRLGIAFMCSVISYYMEQVMFVDLFIKRRIFLRHGAAYFSNRDH